MRVVLDVVEQILVFPQGCQYQPMTRISVLMMWYWSMLPILTQLRIVTREAIRFSYDLLSNPDLFSAITRNVCVYG